MPEPQSQALTISPDGELSVANQSASAFEEIRAAVFLAKQFPRNYNQAWQSLMTACKRRSLAAKAVYRFPRGETTVTGPSVRLARVAAQCYGNIRYGLKVLRDDPDAMHIQGWAWDVESNTHVEADDRFNKLIYRKPKEGRGGKPGTLGGWVTPDERDLRELMFRRGAILIRNCLLQVMPFDLIEDAVAEAAKGLRDGIKDPKGDSKRLLLDFAAIGVTAEMLTEYVGSTEWTPDNIVDLRQILEAIKDGQARREEFFVIGNAKPSGGTTLEEKLKAKADSITQPPAHVTGGGTSSATPPVATPKISREMVLTLIEDNRDVLPDEVTKHYTPERLARYTDAALAEAYGIIEGHLAAQKPPSA